MDEEEGVEDANLVTDNLVDYSVYVQVQMNLSEKKIIICLCLY